MNPILPHNHCENIKAVLARLPDAQDAETVSSLFRLLSDGSRLRLFWLLCHAEECVINLSAIMDMSSPALSHHLRQLKASGLIVSRRAGKEVYYHASDTQQAAALHVMIEHMLTISCPGSEMDAHIHTEHPKE